MTCRTTSPFPQLRGKEKQEELSGISRTYWLNCIELKFVKIMVQLQLETDVLLNYIVFHVESNERNFFHLYRCNWLQPLYTVSMIKM